jgi:tRNA dimethylallyltransferase
VCTFLSWRSDRLGVPRHLALVGPTATGKSSLAFEFARRRDDIELVSGDSMQVYRGMDIGTAKPTATEQEVVPYHLLDLVDPAEEFSIARFQTAARTAIKGIEARGHRALLVGGSGLYLRAVIDDLQVPGQWPEVRAELEAEPDTVLLHRRLATLDPVAAARMEPTNRRRVLRALEVTVGSSRPFSSFGPGLDFYPPSRFCLLGVWLPRTVVARRIAGRYRDQMALGLLNEVKALAHRPLSRTARQALGYRELLDYLAGTCTLEEALDTARRRTVAFSRRQRMWFRRDPRITWLGTTRNSIALLPILLEN